mmetsp:Transcript_27480/g.49729  ORF Transcript_27480/g.49729 Transcript_27480/m.49729 type:complete len:139 (-) Transcript_27480:92-508(-)|eukprot:CAMPEP_0197656612 /NCGR_PEP_ID=MMETSP1338-20131121/42602_1 /TAXON_ID=43686 ORGANISM="Pelagodinium beii, Strain RCC1491" /NCGR_SAMPLE_ID=MMETSP1338 /ASSEMBLY_ACC=CAM_ASM_000754 /LENGTH=138 /DNA_ID=CAMNT_0043232691 /DNA_START=50 /DNA_END=466 /DNA_ORIENTATION=+
MGAGKSVDANLGVIGVDWNENGGGLTLAGLRIGGSSDRGLELGPNPGLGFQSDGNGYYLGARADLGIRDGVNVGSRAMVTTGEQNREVGAAAALHASGLWAGSKCDTPETKAVSGNRPAHADEPPPWHVSMGVPPPQR